MDDEEAAVDVYEEVDEGRGSTEMLLLVDSMCFESALRQFSHSLGRSIDLLGIPVRVLMAWRSSSSECDAVVSDGDWAFLRHISHFGGSSVLLAVDSLGLFGGGTLFELFKLLFGSLGGAGAEGCCWSPLFELFESVGTVEADCECVGSWLSTDCLMVIDGAALVVGRCRE